MRLEAQTKLGYYKTPISVVNKICSWLSFSDRWAFRYSLLDPCAGEGEAIFRVEKYAREKYEAKPIVTTIELDEARHKTIEKVIKSNPIINATNIHAPYERVKLEPQTVSLLWLNPPYDDAGGGQGGTRRKEMIFLEDMTQYLMPYGVLVYIIPHRYISEYMARFLAKHYSKLQVFSFDDDSDGYSDFNQVVIMGIRRDVWVDEDVVSMLTDARENRPPLLKYFNESGANPGDFYRVPTTPQYGVRYSIIEYEAEDICEMSSQSAAWQRLFDDVSSADRHVSEKRPPIPLHSGHIGLLLASGELNGAFGQGDSRHTIKGTVIQRSRETTETDEAGNTTEREIEQQMISIKAINAEGELITLV